MTDRSRTSTLLRWLVEMAVVATAVVIGLQIARGFNTEPPSDDASTETGAQAFDEETPELERLGLREGSAAGGASPSKVVVLDMWPGRTERLAASAPGLDVVVVADEGQALDEMTDASALLGTLTPGLLAAGENLSWVQLASAGVERYLAIPGLAEHDLVLTNAQRIFAPGGGEHVLGLVLALTRRIPRSLELQRARRWDAEAVTGPSPYIGQGSELRELRGRTMLVAGLGGIGTEAARLAAGIGMHVTATRNSSREGPDFVDYVGLSDELIDLVREADVVVNALPLTPSTEGVFDEVMFAAMKPGTIFVNIGRGRTVDTDALTAALESGRLAGAGLDVTEPEPLPEDHPLWGMSGVIITPHVGGDSDGHMERMYLLFEENLRRFAAGEPLLSVVDRSQGY